MREEKLRQIEYISVPESIKNDLGAFKLDPKKKLPVQIPDGQSHLEAKDLTVENIITGMLTIIAYDEAHPNFTYYKSFIEALEPTLAEELNKAAIAKEQQKDYDFAEELFLAVYHMLPQSASCINLATLYSYMAVDEREKKNEEKEDEYLSRAKATLKDGLVRFGENEAILSELSSFEAYMGNLEEAKEYLERYMQVASEGERKQELKRVLKEINLQLEYDEKFKEAYDFVMLGMPEKALESINRFIEGNPKVWNGYFMKGWALRSAKRYSEAKEALLECIKLGESNSDIYNELSICELEGGNRELAKTYLETAADLDEENLSVVSNLALLHMMDGEMDEAREMLEKARFLAGDDALVKNLIDEYERATGEKIGELIHEEIIHDDEDDKDDDGYERELNEINNPDNSDDSSSCSCGHGSGCSCNHDSNEKDHSCSCHCGGNSEKN